MSAALGLATGIGLIISAMIFVFVVNGIRISHGKGFMPTALIISILAGAVAAGITIAMKTGN